jgi:hypothetical protein
MRLPAPLLLQVFLFLLACVAPDMGPMPVLVAPKWRDGETSVYAVSRNDSVLYRSVITLGFDEEISTPPGESTNVTPVIVTTDVVEPVSATQFFFDSVEVTLRRDDLTPLRTYRSIETDLSMFEITAQYEKSRVRVEKQTIDGSVREDLALPPRSYSYDMIPTWLRAVPLVSGTTFRMNLVVPFEFRTVPVKAMVLGTKLVSTGLGDLMCREIVLVLPNREVRFWYELAEPHRFVGLRDSQNETQMLLTSYQPAHADTLPPAGRATARTAVPAEP